MTITHHEVRVRTCRGEVRIPREAVAQVVHVESFALTGWLDGYVILLDAWGTPLWQSLTERWSDETVRALLATGQEVVTVPAAVPAQLEERWPGVLPRRYVEHVRSYWTTVGGTLGAIALLIGVTALVMM